MYKILITKTDEEHRVRASLSHRLIILFFFEVWVSEDYKEGSRDSIFDWVCSWVDEFNIPIENITDLSQEVEL